MFLDTLQNPNAERNSTLPLGCSTHTTVTIYTETHRGACARVRGADLGPVFGMKKTVYRPFRIKKLFLLTSLLKSSVPLNSKQM